MGRRQRGGENKLEGGRCPEASTFWEKESKDSLKRKIVTYHRFHKEMKKKPKRPRNFERGKK